MNEVGVKDFTMHAKSGPRVTVVALYYPDQGTLCFNAAKCREGEIYKKKVGRAIAKGRLSGRKPQCIHTVDGVTQDRVKEAFVAEGAQLLKRLQKNGNALKKA